MKQIIYNIAILFAVFLSGQSVAQVSKVGNHELQPSWGPVGYVQADNYFLPDINMYYNVANAKFVYMVDGLWVSSATLPPDLANYNLYNGRKVVLNTPEPWKNHMGNVAAYSIKTDCNNQLANRDAWDMWKFNVTTYSGYKPPVVTTVTDSTIVSKARSFAGYKRVKVKNACGKVVTVKRPIYKKADNSSSKVVKRTTTTQSNGGCKTACTAPDVTSRSSCMLDNSTNTWSCGVTNSWGGYMPYKGIVIPESPCTSCVKQFSPSDYSCVTTEDFNGYKPNARIKTTTCSQK
jgi:hypothetical protein